jgi:protoporphyrinogen oxidase
MKTEMETVDVAIIGSGISGLAANLKAIESGRHPVIFESRSTAGGLLDSFEINGFTFDRAVHLSFAHEREVRAVFDKTNYITHPAVSRCFDNMIWTKNPIQNNLYPYPVEKKISYIQSFFDRPEALNDNYESWLRHQYGNLIAEDFPIRYTKKYWRVSPEELSINWVGERMRRSDSHEILHGAFTSDTPNTYYTKEMRYPDKGGYKSFIRPLLDSGKIELNKKLIDIDVDRKKLKFEDGSGIFYKQLVSTIPLPEIIAAISQAPAEVVTASRRLFATSVDLISIGFSKNLTSDLWFYIYDDDIFASRAYSPSVKSPNNAPAGCSSIQFEIYSN